MSWDRTESVAAPDYVSVTLHDTSKAARFAGVFRRWAGPDAEHRVVFITPEVLIGVSHGAKRGYLFDDGWTIECWMESSVAAFLELLHAEFPADDRSLEVDRPEDPAPMNGLTVWALESGSPIAAVRHLL